MNIKHLIEQALREVEENFIEERSTDDLKERLEDFDISISSHHIDSCDDIRSAINELEEAIQTLSDIKIEHEGLYFEEEFTEALIEVIKDKRDAYDMLKEEILIDNKKSEDDTISKLRHEITLLTNEKNGLIRTLEGYKTNPKHNFSALYQEDYKNTLNHNFSEVYQESTVKSM